MPHRATPVVAIAGPDHIVLLSEWRDQAALDAHYASNRARPACGRVR